MDTRFEFADEFREDDAGAGAATESTEAEEFVGQESFGANPDHQPMGNGEGGQQAASETSEAAEATEFDAPEGWNPEERHPVPADGAEEALVDAWFAEAANEADAQEFLPILGALLPMVKAVAPMLVGQLAQQGGKLLADRLRRLKLRHPMLRLPVRRETDEEAGLDADIESLVEAAQLLEVVIGTDDRTRVSPTNGDPWRRICHLRIIPGNGVGAFLGTGFFIGRRTVMTAGHCVHMRDNGGWVREVTVTPAKDMRLVNDRPVPVSPFGSVRSTAFRSVRGWVEGRKRDFDYGAIILPRHFHQPAIGAFGFAALPDATLRGARLNTAGYPGDRPRGLPPAFPSGQTMWYHGRVAKSVSARVITYDIDTAGGQSGSPVWLRREGKRTVVGIHTNGSAGGNSATRVVRPVFDNMVAWRREGGD